MPVGIGAAVADVDDIVALDRDAGFMASLPVANSVSADGQH